MQYYAEIASMFLENQPYVFRKQSGGLNKT